MRCEQRVRFVPLMIDEAMRDGTISITGQQVLWKFDVEDQILRQWRPTLVDVDWPHVNDYGGHV